MKTEKISYSELARRVGDCILNNELQSQLAGEYDFELFNGEDTYCYTHEEKDQTGCEGHEEDCNYEHYDVYQTYIVSKDGADYLTRRSEEIVYYCEKLDLYLWGITHFGTSWTGVFTSIKAD